MDPERTKRRQSIKIIVSEALMVLTVAVTVVILAFLVSGYWINSNFEVERQGLLQVSSMPTGADVYIDGDSSWLQRTNTSKVLTSGEHTVKLTKEGYDSWSKTITISEGLLYRLHYPRLFLQQGATESVLSVDKAIYGTVSPDRNKLLLATPSSSWQLVGLDSEEVKPSSIAVSSLLATGDSGESITLSPDAIVSAHWDRDSSHVLVELHIQDTTEWLLLDVNSPDKSINLGKEFGSNFVNVQILDDSANTLLALTSGNLRKIDVSGRVISAPIAENVADYDHYNSSEVVFSAKSTTSSDTLEYYVGYAKLSDGKVSRVLSTASPAKVAISRFYDDKYIIIVQGSHVALYSKDDFALLSEYELSFTPATVEVGHSGEFITMSLGDHIATLDMEIQGIREWTTGSSTFGWLDSDMVYAVVDGELVVYDFDGLNRRVLAQDVSAQFPATVSANDRWLYYVHGDTLMRKVISD